MKTFSVTADTRIPIPGPFFFFRVSIPLYRHPSFAKPVEAVGYSEQFMRICLIPL